jgi:hypothetical protein
MNLKYKYLQKINKKFYSNYKINEKNIKDHYYSKGYDNGFLSCRIQFYDKFKRLNKSPKSERDEVYEMTSYYNYKYLNDNNYINFEKNLFDYNVYLENYSDLRNANIKDKFEAIKHWNKYGINENRNFRKNIKNYKLSCFLVLIEPEKNKIPYDYCLFSLLNICDNIIVIKDSTEDFSKNKIKKISKNIKIIECNESAEDCYNILTSEIKKTQCDFCLLIEGNNIFPHLNFKELRKNILINDKNHLINLNEYIINKNNVICESQNKIKILNKRLLRNNKIGVKIYYKNGIKIIFSKQTKEIYLSDYGYKYLFYFSNDIDIAKKWYKINQYLFNKRIFYEEFKESNIKLILEDFDKRVNNRITLIDNKDELIEKINVLLNNSDIFNILLDTINTYFLDINELNIIYNNIKFYKKINFNIDDISKEDIKIIIKNKFVIHNGNLLNNIYVNEKPIYQTFWMGKSFSNLEYMSLNSFIKNGCIVHLYTYQKEIINIPDKVIIKNASDILPKSELFTYSNDGLGKSSISAFTNLFRFKLLFEKGNYWIDTDLVNIKKFNNTSPFVFTSEPQEFNYKIEYCKKNRISSFIIKIPKNSYIAYYAYLLCLESKKDVLNGVLKWGMGPKAMKSTIIKFELDGYVKPWYFTCNCACHHFMSLFDNEYKVDMTNINLKNNEKYINYFSNLEDKYEDTYFIHLWNQFWNRNNINKNSNFKKNSIMYELKNKFI